MDFSSDISSNKGLPQLDKDYWQRQKPVEKQQENLFDNLIKTNFDVESLKKISVFSPDLKE